MSNLLQPLFDQIRRAWDANLDDAVVYQLAEDHPEHARELFDYSNHLIRGTVDDRVRQDHDVFDSQARSWIANRIGLDPSASSADGSAGSDGSSTCQPLLRLVTECSGKKATEAAHDMGVTPQFISAASRHAASLPSRWGGAFADRAHDAFGIPRDQTENSFRHGLDSGRLAASRRSAFGSTPTPEQVLDQGGITDPSERAYWLGLTDNA